MNKNNFMKAMTMIDEDIMQEAGNPDTAAAIAEKSEDSFTEYGSKTIVSGVDVYHKSVWKKFLATAASLVIVVGAIGGGALYFSHFKTDKNAVDTDIVDDMEFDSIYSKLKANQDKYRMSTDICLFDNTRVGFPDADKDQLFDFLDHYDMKTEITEKDFSKTPTSIVFSFSTDEKIYFTFTLYENGYFLWTEKAGNSEKTTYHRMPEDEAIFDTVKYMFELESELSDLNVVTNEEICNFVNENFAADQGNTAYKHSDSISWEIEITDREAIKKVLSELEWERAEFFIDSDYFNYCYEICGVNVSEYGYLKGNYHGYEVVYSLKYYSDLEKLSRIWQEYLKMDNSSQHAINNALQEFKYETIAQKFEGPCGAPQGRICYDTKSRYFTITDTEEMIREISSFEWESCSYEEIEKEIYYIGYDQWMSSIGSYEIGVYAYGGKLSLYPDGYMIIADFGYYKLKNENDCDRFRKIFDKYLVMDEISELAEKICNGITNYDNLKAHITYEVKYSGETDEIFDGTLSVDAKNEKLYMIGNGIISNNDKEETIELVMNGHDNSAFRTTDKVTGEQGQLGIYRYSNGYTVAPPDNYIYLCKVIEKELSPRMASVYIGRKYELETNISDDGNTQITVHCKSVSEEYYENDNFSISLLLTEKGQIISCELTSDSYKESFRLDDYVFNSDNFTIVDTETIYESIKETSELINGG